MECLVRIGGSVAGKIIEYTIAPTGRQLGYIFYYRSNINELKTEIRLIKNAKDRLQHSVDEATRKLEEIEADVSDWLSRACNMIEEADGFIQNEDQATSRYCNGMFPNLVLRHQLSRKAKRITQEVIKVRNEGKFERVSYHLTLEGIIENNGYEAFETRKSIVVQIMEALKDPIINIIGINGMAGIGKTMLAKEVGRQALEEGLFKVVILITISQNPNFEKIQEEIAEKLNLVIREKTMSIRAKRLQLRLRQEKDILIILDDIWEKFDLQYMGISFEDDQKGCKILMTSRFQDVLCDDMDASKNFHVGILSDNEALNLFIKNVGELIKKSHFQNLAVQIVKECAGLPIAISTVACALKNKSLFTWKDALIQLQRSCPTNIKDMDEKVYKSIRLSYDFLKSEEAQSLFLLCCLYEEEARISIKNLLRYGFGLGLFKHVYTLEETRCRLYTLLNKLKSCCLLLEGDEDWYVKMHEVTRDVGLLIASEERNMYYIRSDVELEKFLSDKILNDSVAISLSYDEINYLPQMLNCKRVLLLILMWKSRSMQIPKSFFEETGRLKVLDLFCSNLKPLPPSFCSLRDLRTLCLANCTLGDVAIIGEFKNLEILDFSNSDIEQFPREIGQLTHLRLLDLSYCKKLKVIQSSAISRLKVLEELDMKRTFNIKWEVEGDNIVEKNNASIAELKQLTNLKTLRLDILDINILPEDLFNEKLNAYEISIGLDGHLPYAYESRSKKFNNSVLQLKFKQLTKLKENYSLLMLLKKSEVLFLDGLESDNDSVVSELDINGFPYLKHLNIKNNAKIHYIVDLKGMIHSCTMFQNLEILTLESLEKLEMIYHGKLIAQSFNSLQVIEVHDCHKLKDLLSLSIAKCLLQLKTIEVIHCNMIEEIVTNDYQSESNAIIFPQLCSLKLCDVPNLLYFYSELKPSERTLPFFNDKLLSSTRCFRNLSELCVQQCGPLKYVFSSSIVANLGQLIRLEIRHCEMIEEIVSMDQRIDKLQFPYLKSLQLSQLPKLTRFSTRILIDLPLLNELEIVGCPELKTLIYPSMSTKSSVDEELKERKSDENLCTSTMSSLLNDKFLASNLTKLVVERCGSLKYLTSSSVAMNLAHLIRLEISNCEMIEEIISPDQRVDILLFPKLDYLHLSNLPNLTRFCTGTIIEFPLLVKLRIVNCPEFSSFVCNSTSKNTSDQRGQGDTKSKNIYCSTTFSLFHDMVAIPNVQIINIRGLHNLKMIWQGQARSTCFQNLMQLHIGECGSLKYLFSSYAAVNLTQLNKLKISCCERMEAIISIDHTMDELIFPGLDYLELSYLPKFTRFCNGISCIKFPFLSELRMEDCPEFMCFVHTSLGTNMPDNEEQNEMNSKNGELCTTTLSLLNDKVAFPNLKIINIRRLNRLRMIWEDQLTADSLCKLKVVEVQYCENLSFILPPNMLSKLHNLRRLFILPCKMLEEVTYDLDLENIILVGKDGHEEGPFDLYSILGGKENCKTVFSHVKSLQLQAIPTLMHLFEENSHPSEAFQTLEDILVWNCDKLKSLVPSSISLSNLTSLSVSRCHGMVNLLSSSTARSLVRLQDMSIDECQTITEIIANQNSDADTKSEIIFNQLEVLRLNKLPSLTYFHFGNSLMRFPKLKTVVVMECPEMQSFCSVMSPIVGDLSNKSFQNLEMLFVRRCASLKNLIPLSIFFENLMTLRLEACNGMLSLLSCSNARTLKRLKTLSIIKCQRMTEIISSEGRDSDHEESEIIFYQLETLALHKLPRFTSFHSGKCTMRFPKLKTVIMMECPDIESFRFQNLEILDVGVCGKLKNLVPSSISLQNLTTLRLSSCNGMLNLLSCLTAKSLAHLKNMSISECQIMTEIIANDERDDFDEEGEVIFNSLEVLELHSLPSLTSFHSGNCIMRFPKLKRVIITSCPEMQSFSYGVTTPNLEKIITRINERYIRRQNCWNIKGYFEELEQASPLEELWSGDIHSTIQDLWENNH